MCGLESHGRIHRVVCGDAPADRGQPHFAAQTHLLLARYGVRPIWSIRDVRELQWSRVNSCDRTPVVHAQNLLHTAVSTRNFRSPLVLTIAPAPDTHRSCFSYSPYQSPVQGMMTTQNGT